MISDNFQDRLSIQDIEIQFFISSFKWIAFFPAGKIDDYRSVVCWFVDCMSSNARVIIFTLIDKNSHEAVFCSIVRYNIDIYRAIPRIIGIHSPAAHKYSYRIIHSLPALPDPVQNKFKSFKRLLDYLRIRIIGRHISQP